MKQWEDDGLFVKSKLGNHLLNLEKSIREQD